MKSSFREVGFLANMCSEPLHSEIKPTLTMGKPEVKVAFNYHLCMAPNVLVSGFTRSHLLSRVCALTRLLARYEKYIYLDGFSTAWG